MANPSRSFTHMRRRGLVQHPRVKSGCQTHPRSCHHPPSLTHCAGSPRNLTHRQASHLRSQAAQSKVPIKSRIRIYERKTHWIINNSDYEAAARTCRDLLIICELLPRNFEAVSAWTRVVVHTLYFVPSHVLDLNLVIVRSHYRIVDSRWVSNSRFADKYLGYIDIN